MRGRIAACGTRGSTGRRGCRGRDHHGRGRGLHGGDLPGDAQAQAATLELDFRQAGLVEQPGKVADKRVIDGGFVFAHAFASLAAGPSSAAAPSIARP